MFGCSAWCCRAGEWEEARRRWCLILSMEWAGVMGWSWRQGRCRVRVGFCMSTSFQSPPSPSPTSHFFIHPSLIHNQQPTTLRTNPTATATPSPPPPPPSDPLIYPVPRSPVTLTFFNYGNPVPRNPALICIGAAENDFWERAAATGAKLDKAVGQTLEYRFRRVHLTVVPVGEVRGLRC